MKDLKMAELDVYKEFVEKHCGEEYGVQFEKLKRERRIVTPCVFGKFLEDYLEKHAEAKDSLKPYLINFLQSLEGVDKLFAIGSVASSYSDNDSIKELINLTAGCSNRDERLSSCYEKIFTANPSKEVFDALGEKIEAYNESSGGSWSLNISKLWHVLENKKDETTYYVANRLLDKQQVASVVEEIAGLYPELCLDKLEKINYSEDMLSKICFHIAVKELSEKDAARYKEILLKNITKDVGSEEAIVMMMRALQKQPREMINEDDFNRLKNNLFAYDFKDGSEEIVYEKLTLLCPNEKYAKELLDKCKELDICNTNILSQLYKQINDRDFILELCREKEHKFLEGDSFSEIENLEITLQEKNYIETTLKAQYPELSVEEALVRAAVEARQSNDPKKREDFNTFILAEGESKLAEYDEKVVDWLAENLTNKNLEDVNALRAFYGLKLTVNENPQHNGNRNAVIRSQFDGAYSQTDRESKFYEIQYSKVYRDFLDSEDKTAKKYEKKSYKEFLEQSEAVKLLMKYGYDDTVKALPGVLREADVPPELSAQFNVKDLQDLCITYREDTDDGWKDRIFFDESNIEGNTISAKRKFWQDIAENNPEIVKTISEDMRRRNIEDDDIETFWDNARECGNPHFRYCPVSLQVHHREAIKDGGTNAPDNFVIVVKYDNFSAHDLLHRRDTPLKSDQITHKETGQKIRLSTEFIDDIGNTDNKIRFYGGLRQCSRYAGIIKDMFNVPEFIEKTVMEKEQKKAAEEKVKELKRKIAEKNVQKNWLGKNLRNLYVVLWVLNLLIQILTN